MMIKHNINALHQVPLLKLHIVNKCKCFVILTSYYCLFSLRLFVIIFSLCLFVFNNCYLWWMDGSERANQLLKLVRIAHRSKWNDRFQNLKYCYFCRRCLPLLPPPSRSALQLAALAPVWAGVLTLSWREHLSAMHDPSTRVQRGSHERQRYVWK